MNENDHFDLLKQLKFYGSYHHNQWNQLVHFIFVPLIVWSVAVWCAHSGPLIPTNLPQPYNQLLSINSSLVGLICYAVYYTMLDQHAGITWGLFIGLPIWILANATWAFVHVGWLWAVGAHIFSWYMQIHLGHMVLEGRKPALLDSFFQSMVLAPLFVWFELLFLMGYRPDLYKALNEQIEKELNLLKSASCQKSVGIDCSSGGNMVNECEMDNKKSADCPEINAEVSYSPTQG